MKIDKPTISDPSGIAGGNATILRAIAAVALGGGRAVMFSAGSGQLVYADASLATEGRFAGITSGAVGLGQHANVVVSGKITDSSWSLTPDLPVFLGSDGMLSQTPPTGAPALYSQIVGYAVSSDSIWVDPQPPILF